MGVDGGDMDLKVESVFIGAGCNRIVNNVSWGACGLISFGAQNGVAIFCPKTAQILTTLPGHKSTVNCTHWLPSSKFAFQVNNSANHYLLSGDAEGIIFLWEYVLADMKWRNVLQLPEKHKKGVTCITVLMVSSTMALFASSSSDGAVYLWEVIIPSGPNNECELSLLDSSIICKRPVVALSLTELLGNSNRIALAVGGLDNKIQIYSGERTGQLSHSCELKGHTDWIRSLDFSFPIHENGETESLLVSSSQDRGIRIWKLALRKEETSLSSYIKGPIFSCGSFSYQISLEALLVGHDDWVYSVEWQPPSVETERCRQSRCILSASMDKTMMIWQPEKTTGIWTNVVTVGELSHCALGFYGGRWSPNGDSILAHGYGGSFHLWKNLGVDFEDWKPLKVPSGHFAAVSDISWAGESGYLLSVSHDQTTRVFSSWRNGSSVDDREAWYEIARAQVHGHDINCAALITGEGNHRFVSGAEEKVIRVFEAPLSFLRTLNYALGSSKNSLGGDVPANLQQVLGANMSALGLSQKPIYLQVSSSKSGGGTDNEGIGSIETVPEAVPVAFTEPPIEDQLAWHTLWPETHKLYGHGNELFSVCCNREGTLVASSCKASLFFFYCFCFRAQTSCAAEIWLWQVGSWKAVGRLKSHALTVTQMEFSHDDRFLLSVSRDRHFSVFSIRRTG
ncbi:hypothetical protein M569_14298, partial [Genlisea aurea]